MKERFLLYGYRVRSPKPTARAGFSLVEVVVAVAILSIGLLALGAAAGQSIRRSASSAEDMAVWTDVARVADSLTAVGWGNVTNGIETHPRHNIAWSVSSPSANLDRLDIVITHRNALGNAAIQDTVALLLSRP